MVACLEHLSFLEMTYQEEEEKILRGIVNFGNIEISQVLNKSI